jgi:hypothetical protein
MPGFDAVEMFTSLYVCTCAQALGAGIVNTMPNRCLQEDMEMVNSFRGVCGNGAQTQSRLTLHVLYVWVIDTPHPRVVY